MNVQELVRRWWLGASLLLIACCGTTAVALEAWPQWLDQPLAPDPRAAGVVRSMGMTSIDVVDEPVDALDVACATNWELEDPAIVPDYDYARVAYVDGEPLHACWRGGSVLFLRGALLDSGGDDVESVDRRARAGVVAGNGGRTAVGIVLWGLLLPSLTIAWTYIYQAMLYTSSFFRWVTRLAFAPLLVVYVLITASSLHWWDGPGALAAGAGTVACMAALLLGRLTVGRASRGVPEATPRPEAAGRGAARRRRRASSSSTTRPNREDTPDGDRTVADPPRRERAAPLDVNAASVDEIAALPGVGPVTARLVVERREQDGRIRNFHDFCDIVRPTRRVRQQLRPRVEFGRGRSARRANPDHGDVKDPYGGRRVDL